MEWIKKGLIYQPDTKIWWSQNYGILPTPFFLENENILRIYFASTDADNDGRIGYIDVNPDNPSEITAKGKDFILDTGRLGAFDDSGVNPSCILKNKEDYFLYYIGYQRHQKTPYSIMSGLAIGREGNNFERKQETPILERTSQELFIRSAPTVLREGENWKMWYVSAYNWEKMNTKLFQEKLMPKYVIKYADSKAGITWTTYNEECISPISEEEFGFGRPWVLRKNEKYCMWYSVRKRNTSYRYIALKRRYSSRTFRYGYLVTT